MFIFNLGAYKKYVTKSKININKEPVSLPLSVGNYYAEDAFKLDDLDLFKNEKVIVTEEYIDLRLFGDCPYLLGASDLCWFDYIKKPKPHGNYISKSYIRWIKRRHKQIFNAESFSNSSFFILLQSMAICAMWFMGGHLYYLLFTYGAKIHIKL